MTWKLFLDDVRELPRCLEGQGFIVVRNVEAAQRMTMLKGYPTEIWLDHDLGEGAPGGDAPNYIKWLAGTIQDNAHEHAVSTIAVRVHSHNVQGSANMCSFWRTFRKVVTGVDQDVPYTPYHPNMPYSVDEFNATRWIF
jgi:hypothetical protein